MRELEYENIALRVAQGKARAYTLGELTASVGARTPMDQRHPSPHGCQWARSCDDCPWDDCVIANESDLFSYDSEKAKEMRSDFTNKARVEGTPIKELAVALKVSPSTVKRRSGIRGKIKSARYGRMSELYGEGMSVADIALLSNVHARTVRRALAASVKSDTECLPRPLLPA